MLNRITLPSHIAQRNAIILHPILHLIILRSIIFLQNHITRCNPI